MKKIFLGLLSIALFSGCKDDPATVPPSLTVVENVFNLTSNVATKASIVVKSNVQWSASSDALWCTVTPIEGNGDATVLADVAENADVDGRTAKITFSALGIEPVVVTINQGQKDKIEIDTTTYTLPVEGGAKDLSFKSNITPQYDFSETASWLTQIAPAPKGLVDCVLKINVAANNQSMDSRTTTVKIKCGTESINLTFVQDGVHPRAWDSTALVNIYTALDGENWPALAKWDITKPIDTYKGIRLNNDRVVELVLYDASSGTKGVFPCNEVAKLTMLNKLGIAGSQITGELSSVLENLPLTFIEISKTGIQKITWNWGKFKQVTEVNITGLATIATITTDSLQSPLFTPEWADMTSLKKIAINGCKGLNEGIPESWGTAHKNDSANKFPALTNISILNSNITGAIPASFGDLGTPKLIFISFAGCKLSGEIPASLVKLSTATNAATFTGISLSGNNLEGTLPSGLGAWPTKVGQFNVTQNRLSGVLPADLFNTTTGKLRWKSTICTQQTGYGFTNCL